MKLRRYFITVPLTAAAAFTAVFLWARGPAHETHPPGLKSKEATPRKDTAGGAATETLTLGAAANFHDAVLERALSNPDLIAAVKEIMAHGDEDHCADTRLICLVESLPASRMAELPAVLEANADNDYVVRFILGPWTRRDTEGAGAWVDSHPALNESGCQTFLYALAKVSPGAVLDQLDAQPVSTALAEQREVLIEAMSETDPAGTLELMKARGWLSRNPDALLKLMRNWAGADPHAALGGLRTVAGELGIDLQGAANGGDPATSSNQAIHSMLSALLNGAFDRNPADAAALLREFSEAELAVGRQAIATELLSRDPAAAAELFGSTPEALGRNGRKLLLGVAEESPAMAMSMFLKVTDPELQRDLLLKASSGSRGFGNGSDALVPAEARSAVTRFLATLTNPSERDQVTGSLAVANAKAAPEWSAELWKGLPSAQQREQGLFFMQSLAKSDPAIAIATYSSSPPEVQATAWKGLCSGLATNQPDQALQLVLQNQETASRTEGAATLFAWWSESAPEAALAALEANAAQLDLRAIAAELPNAGRFNGSGRFTSAYVNTQAVAGKIQQLLDSQPASPAPQ